MNFLEENYNRFKPKKSNFDKFESALYKKKSLSMLLIHLWT